jgi:hypothetical protein
MRKLFNCGLLPFVLFVCVLAVNSVVAQDKGVTNQVVSFKKRELNSGFVFNMNKEQEELLTDEIKFTEDRTLFNAKFRFENKSLNLLDYKQEHFDAAFEVGPLGGYGSYIDSSYSENIEGDHNYFGIRTYGDISYVSRFYYDTKNYTLLEVSAWGRYEVYTQNSKGTTIDSLGVSSDFDTKDTKDRLRYGFTARGGWGVGRLSPMNHLMTADYLLRKYYPGRNFSDYEIAQFAQVIANVKHDRDYKVGHVDEKEMLIIAGFLKNTLMLTLPESMSVDWQFSEFDPRYQGQRFEFGPQFTYYNQEPDFVYGGYLKYENSKYQNVSWNRNISAEIEYSRYESQDWMTAEIDLGWSYYTDLKSQFDFGVKYVPGIVLDGFEDVGPLSHNFIPYLAYYTQLNSKSRISFDFAWRIADDEQFVLSGPEFSLAIYRSRY